MNEILQNQIFIAGLDLEFKSVPLADHSPIGMQIARAGGFTPDQMAVVLQALPSGVLEDIRPDEVVDLVYRLKINFSHACVLIASRARCILFKISSP
ncbi:multiubiquitin domain-containing protein, partial [Pseudomonas syringae group genomosp. 3]|uniref:multiubiquitin domain-containing protein n=2 Tax=Pseudomonas syringae group genomosp. 3 TaxID=251701 RepID=UPI0005C9B851